MNRKDEIRMLLDTHKPKVGNVADGVEAIEKIEAMGYESEEILEAVFDSLPSVPEFEKAKQALRDLLLPKAN